MVMRLIHHCVGFVVSHEAMEERDGGSCDTGCGSDCSNGVQQVCMTHGITHPLVCNCVCHHHYYVCNNACL